MTTTIDSGEMGVVDRASSAEYRESTTTTSSRVGVDESIVIEAIAVVSLKVTSTFFHLDAKANWELEGQGVSDHTRAFEFLVRDRYVTIVVDPTISNIF